MPNDAAVAPPARQPGDGRHRRELHPRHGRGAVRIPLGRVLATPGALRALADARANPAGYLARHAAGDWGELDAEDWAANDRALAAGARLLSAYRLPTGERVWIITEADRGSTIMCIQPASARRGHRG